MRKKLTKAERKSVYDKCNGHCAYCGCEIPFKGFQIDHVKSLYRYEADEDVESIENMLPACRNCNFYKSTFTIEEFRERITGIPQRLARDMFIYRLALRFGIVEEHHEPIRFYFENLKRMEEEVNQDEPKKKN